MTDESEIFRQTRKKITPNELNDQNQLEEVINAQKEVAKEMQSPKSIDKPPFEITGKNIPPEFLQALQNRKGMSESQVSKTQDEDDDENFETFEAPPEKPRIRVKKAPSKVATRMQGSDNFKALIDKLAGYHQWEEFKFPSRSKFYENVPEVIHVRAMTGEEEQILATPRWVKKGKAIDMIFRKCIKEPIDTETLLSVDRTNLLIYLRGISYTPEYDVEIKCPNCGIKFAHVIELDDLDVKLCPEEFSPETLAGVLPVSGFEFSYSLATGADEQEISNYREKRINQYGDQGEDDTLLYRTALLLDEIEGVTMKKELAELLKKLPIQDVAHLRNEINTPPFGVDTMIPILCPSCSEEFKIDLPLETNFFFPKKREERTQA